MVKIYQEGDDKSKQICSVKAFATKEWYSIYRQVNQFPFHKDDHSKSWKIRLPIVMDLVNKINENCRDTVHIDFDIVIDYIKSLEYETNLIKLRNKLSGISCGVKLTKGNKLLPFQEVGVHFMSLIKNGIIADKVGLGKTIQAIALSRKMQESGKVQKTFIVLKASLKKKWQREILKFIKEESIILDGDKNARRKKYHEFMNGDINYLIVTYDTFRIDWEYYINSYIPKKFNVIFDEVQQIKNTRAKRSVSCRELVNHNKCCSKIGLTATYIETGLQDMFGIMVVIDKSIFGSNAMSFQQKYLHLSYMGKIVGYKNVEDAAKKMKLCSVRRRKPEVKDQLDALLPSVVENNLWVDLTKKQKECYNETLAGIVDKFNDMERAEKISMANALTQIGYLRQACLSTELFDYEVHESAKIDILLETLPEIVEDNKVLIFSYYTKFVDIIERELIKSGIRCFAMHGKRVEGQSKNRQKYIDLFSKSKKRQVLVASDILSEGVDIPAASYVINMDLLWNPAKMVQRNGRIDRLNQKAKTIYNINILSNGTIEEEMYNRVYERYKTALEVMDDGVEENRVAKMTFKDLKSMLKVVK